MVRICRIAVSLQSFRTVGTDSFDYVFRLFRDETLGQSYRRDPDVRQAEGPVADAAGKMYVAGAVESVVVVTDAELVRAGAVVYVVEQVGITQNRERAEERGLVHGRQRVFQVRETERPGQGITYLAPYEKPDRGDADSGLLKYLFVR